MSVGLVDLASPSRPRVRTSERSRHAAPSIAPEKLAAGQVAPRPPLSRPPAPGSVVRRNGRIVAAPRPASRLRDEDAEFEKWLAMPLAISDSDPDYQEAPVWLPEDRRLRAERRHKRIARRTRAQLFGTSAATTIAAAGCCVALAAVLSQTETVGGSLGVPSIGLFGTRPAPSAEPARRAATVSKPAAKPAARKPARSAPARRPQVVDVVAASSNQVRASTNNSGARRTPGSSTPDPAAHGDTTSAPPPRPRATAARAGDQAEGVHADEVHDAEARPGSARQQLTVGLGQPVARADGEPSL